MEIQYLYRIYEGIKVVYKDRTIIKDISTINFINELCIEELSTYRGRIDATRKKHGLKSMIPVYVSDNCILFPNMSPRHYECIWINYFQIKNIKEDEIIMKDNSKIKVGKKTITTQLSKCEEIVF